MIRIDSSWSGLPHAPNIIAPRQNLLTETPVRPSWRCSTAPFLPEATRLLSPVGRGETARGKASARYRKRRKHLIAALASDSGLDATPAQLSLPDRGSAGAITRTKSPPTARPT